MKSPTTQTHLVLKLADCQKYLGHNELGNLGDIIRKVSQGRKSEGKQDAEYLVINTDEPYARVVADLINTEEAKWKPR